jgi:hypothetical protein
MFKQTGYQEAVLPNGSQVSILHGTAVLMFNPEGAILTLQTGGWHTRATAKAMNHGLDSCGLSDRLSVRLVKGSLQVIEAGQCARSIGHKLSLVLAAERVS